MDSVASADLKHVCHAATELSVPKLRFTIHLRFNYLLSPPHVFFNHPSVISIRGGHSHIVRLCLPLLAHRSHLEVLRKRQEAQEQFSWDAVDANLSLSSRHCWGVNAKTCDSLDNVNWFFWFSFCWLCVGKCSEEFSHAVLDRRKGRSLDSVQCSESITCDCVILS